MVPLNVSVPELVTVRMANVFRRLMVEPHEASFRFPIVSGYLTLRVAPMSRYMSEFGEKAFANESVRVPADVMVVTP